MHPFAILARDFSVQVGDNFLKLPRYCVVTPIFRSDNGALLAITPERVPAELVGQEGDWTFTFVVPQGHIVKQPTHPEMQPIFKPALTPEKVTGHVLPDTSCLTEDELSSVAFSNLAAQKWAKFMTVRLLQGRNDVQTLFGTIRGRFSHMHTLEQKAENAVTRLVQEQKLRLEVTRTMKALQTQINDLQGQGQTITDQKEELDEAKSRLLSFEEELESLCRENACLVKQVAAGSKNLEDLCTQHTAQLTTAQNDLKDARIERTTAKNLAKKQARTILALEAAAEAAAERWRPRSPRSQRHSSWPRRHNSRPRRHNSRPHRQRLPPCRQSSRKKMSSNHRERNTSSCRPRVVHCVLGACNTHVLSMPSLQHVCGLHSNSKVHDLPIGSLPIHGSSPSLEFFVLRSP